MFKALTKWLPSRNERMIKRYARLVTEINALEEKFEALDADAIKQHYAAIRERLTKGENEMAVLPEVFALVREASKRELGLRHFDVQMVGGMVLQDGKIAEMQTGEGKTLVATLPACLNAACGRNVHIVTVNDYLASRDSEWMAPIYRYLGLSVGTIVSQQSGKERAEAYAADITYGTNNEFGFDYLRDNMVLEAAHRVQGELNYAIVDEVDSILIDEARTPLIISGPAERSEDMHKQMSKLVQGLKAGEDEEGDYTVDEKTRQIVLSERGHQRVEDLLAQHKLLPEGTNLYDLSNIGLMHYVNAALRAKSLFQKNVDYLVKDGRVLIVDEFTGRVMPGRRWSDGLHQAIEAKEGVKVQGENQTMASITFQNYFRNYDKLAGMTGTADTEAYEFQQIYGLEVMRVPTHKPMVRDDMSDLIYLTAEQKYDAILEDVQSCIRTQQPVLIGTASIESSEKLAQLLTKNGIKHNVLNAKFHEQESGIIAQAGRPGSVTIATNMAGRGTDIVLGGMMEEGEDGDAKAQWEKRHKQVVDAGGLHIIGTERHESRRIDNQLRGRAGRQGDPGSSRFYLSLEDSLMRIFAGEKIRAMMDRIGIEEGEAIEHPWVTRAIENAQRKVEARNFDMRKTLLEYDNVANEQRHELYDYRNEVISEPERATEDVHESIKEVLEGVVNRFIVPGTVEEQWDLKGLEEALKERFGLDAPCAQWLKDTPEMERADIVTRIIDIANETMNTEPIRDFEDDSAVIEWAMIDRMLTLRVLDHHWREHLAAMDYLRQGIGLRSFAQRNPKQEYKREAFKMFKTMMDSVDYDVARHVLMVRTNKELMMERAPQEPTAAMDATKAQYEHATPEAMSAGVAPLPQKHPSQARQQGRSEGARATPTQPIRNEHAKIKRNDPCFCGSGKKYKQCHGK